METLAVEAALQVRVNGTAFTTTMRTPGSDAALARGLLFTEGILTDATTSAVYQTMADPETGHAAVIDVLVPESAIERSVDGRRTMLSSSSCGVCGTREPADLEVYGPPLRMPAPARLRVADIAAMRRAMQARQELFRATGGTHAAAVFDDRGALLEAHEDVGRHNAVDKCVGALLNVQRLDKGIALFVSGRVSYEIVYKAYRASLPVICAVSAATSLATESAERLGITLVGFCRDDRATVYAHAERILAERPVQS